MTKFMLKSKSMTFPNQSVFATQPTKPRTVPCEFQSLQFSILRVRKAPEPMTQRRIILSSSHRLFDRKPKVPMSNLRIVVSKRWNGGTNGPSTACLTNNALGSIQPLKNLNHTWTSPSNPDTRWLLYAIWRNKSLKFHCLVLHQRLLNLKFLDIIFPNEWR